MEKYIDIIFANEEEAKAFTGMDAETAIFRLSELCETAVVKVGAEGSWLKSGEEVIKIGTIPVKCKDTTGAGDLYAAGFLYGYANNLDLEKCGLIGALMAGNVIEIIGARIREEDFVRIKKEIQILIDSD